jgi:hypothetical protein
MSISSRAIVAVVAILVAAVPPAGAATVQLVAGGRVLSNARVTDRGKLIGFVGDFVQLEDGIHEIAVDAPRDYILEVTAKVTGQEVEVTATNPRPANCKPELAVTWPVPRLRPHDSFKGVLTAVLGDPQFGAPTGRMQCSMPSMAACTNQKIVLTTSSDPAGAEIWINGKKQPFRTNVTLSVPYCLYETSKDLLLRLPNAVNCERRIALAPDAEVAVTCSLGTPGAQ